MGVQGANPPRSSGNIVFYSTKNGQKTSAFLPLQAYFFLKFWLSLERERIPEKNIEDCASRRREIFLTTVQKVKRIPGFEENVSQPMHEVS